MPVRARRERTYTLKRIAQRAVAAGNLAEAREVGTEALWARFGFEWAGYRLFVWLRSAAALAARPAGRAPGQNTAQPGVLTTPTAR